MAATVVNGLPTPPASIEKPSMATSAPPPPPRVVLAGKTGRILCVADIRGDYHELNRLIREHEATAVIHTGDFGFINADSLERMGDKILKHLLTYSPLIPSLTRKTLLDIPASEGRAALIDALNKSSIHFPLSQFPHLLTGAITFPVPVFTVWGLIEDVRILEKFRTGEYEVQNLHVLDEVSTRVVDVGGMKLRLFGLGGAVSPHKLFDIGEGYATIAGSQGTMWTTCLQMGELLETASRHYNPTETRLLVTSAPVSRTGLLDQLAIAVKADLTISSGLHFRYPASLNDYAAHTDFESWRLKLVQARDTMIAIYNSVKDKVDQTLSEQQQHLLKRAVTACSQVPEQDDGTWTNTWHWVLSDASCGHMLLSITDSRVSAEMRSSGLNFAHRTASKSAPPTGPIASTPLLAPVRRPNAPEPAQAKPASTITAQPPALTQLAVRPAQPPASMPAKPPAEVNQMNNVRGIMPRPAQGALGARIGGLQGQQGPGSQQGQIGQHGQRGPPFAQQGQQNSVGASSAPSGQGPIAPKTGPPPRGPRGPAAAGNGFGGNANLPNKPLPPRAQQTGPGAKGPAVNGKSPAATPAADDKSKELASGPRQENNNVSRANGDRKANQTDLPKKDERKADGAATPVGSAGKNVDSDKKDRDAGVEKTASGSGLKRPVHSLYIKGIPVPTTEEAIKGMFGETASKISQVKIIADHMKKTQKDYAYIDFRSEEDMQAALKACSNKIGETSVSSSVSNPPVRGGGDSRGGRGGRGGARGGRGGARGGGQLGSGGPSRTISNAEGGGKKEGSSTPAPAAPPAAAASTPKDKPAASEKKD